MNDIVFQGSEGQPLTNSVLVAEKFDRRHDNVYQAIGKLLITCPEKLGHLFVESSYIDRQGPSYVHHEPRRIHPISNGLHRKESSSIQARLY